MKKTCFYNKKKYYLCIAFNKRHSLFAICLAELAQLVEQRIRNAWVLSIYIHNSIIQTT